MHIVESYATSCGLKINDPFILQKFFPLNIDKYITLHPFGKFESRHYDYWEDVITILADQLKDEGIHVLQIGTAEDRKLKGCLHCNGQTNVNQTAYIINHALIHVGIDSFPVHLASTLNTPMVALYSNMYAGHSKPYWGDSSKHILLEADRKGKKPTYSATENPKTINSIKPETIAKAICDLLGLEFKFDYSTVYTGPSYSHRLIESVPNTVCNISKLGIDSLIVRMDLHFDEEILQKQLEICPCSVVTNREIDKKIIEKYKPHIKELVYYIGEDHSPEFVEFVQQRGIAVLLLTYLEQDKIDSMKLDYIDLGIINKKEIPDPKDIEELKDRDLSELFFRSNKIILSEEKAYPSVTFFKQGKSIETYDDIVELKDDEDFWKELEYYTLFEKKK